MVDARSLEPGQHVYLADDCVEQRINCFGLGVEPLPEQKISMHGVPLTVKRVELQQSIYSKALRHAVTLDIIYVEETDLFWFEHELSYSCSEDQPEFFDACSFDRFVSSL